MTKVAADAAGRRAGSVAKRGDLRPYLLTGPRRDDGPMKRDIEASTEVRAAIERARDVLIGDPGCVAAERCTADMRRERRFHTTLAVELGGGGSVHEEVVIELGPAWSNHDAVALPIHWRAARHQRLFPTFDGELEASRRDLGSNLTLRGAYTVPLGPLGRFGEAIGGRRLARQSLVAFLEQAARRLDDEVDGRMKSASRHPAPYPVALREVRSEHYIG